MAYADGTLDCAGDATLPAPAADVGPGEYVMLLCAVTIGAAYPVTRDIDYHQPPEVALLPEEVQRQLDISVFHYAYPSSTLEEVRSKRQDKALMAGYDAHCIHVSRETYWQCPPLGAAADALEVVVKHESQILPLFKVYFSEL